MNTNFVYSIIHVFKTMSVAELNTLHTICEVERTQLLTIFAMSVKNPQFAGFLLTQNRSKFLYVEASTAWIYDCPRQLSPSDIAEQCYDCVPVSYLTLLCTLTQLHVKHLIMQINFHKNITPKILLLLTLIRFNIFS